MKSDRELELEAWARHAVRGLPESKVFCNIWNDTMRADPLREPMPLIQMGYAMFLDKPIVVLVPRGATIPDHLARAADRVLTFDPDVAGDLERASHELAAFVKAHR